MPSGGAPQPADPAPRSKARTVFLLNLATAAPFLLLALACGGLLDWESYLSHGRCGQFSRVGYVAPAGWTALAVAWCAPALPVFFGWGRGARRFYLVEAAAMAVPLAGLAAVLSLPDAVECNEWSGLSLGMLLVPLLLLHFVVVGVGLVALRAVKRTRQRRMRAAPTASRDLPAGRGP